MITIKEAIELSNKELILDKRLTRIIKKIDKVIVKRAKLGLKDYVVKQGVFWSNELVDVIINHYIGQGFNVPDRWKDGRLVEYFTISWDNVNVINNTSRDPIATIKDVESWMEHVDKLQEIKLNWAINVEAVNYLESKGYVVSTIHSNRAGNVGVTTVKKSHRGEQHE